MFEIVDGIARGNLARIVTLREERLTRDAQRLFGDLVAPVDGTSGRVPTGVQRHSPQEALRELIELERARLALRQARKEEIQHARDVLAEISSRIGPRVREPYLQGERRRRLLSAVAVAFSRVGDELQAIEISKFLIRETGAPDTPAEIVSFGRETRLGEQARSRLVAQLQNIAVRRMRLAYLQGLGGDVDAARALLTEAREAGEAALQLRDGSDRTQAVQSRLLSRATLATIEVEQPRVHGRRPGRPTRPSSTSWEHVVTTIVSESYELSAVRPKTRLLRAAELGMVFVEQALLADVTDGDADATERAWAGRALLKPHIDVFVTDADEAPAKAVRYGHACRLSGDTRTAATVWQRSRDRLALYRGEDHPAVAAIDRLLGGLRTA